MATTLPILRNSSVAAQLEIILRERIHAGIYPPGERLPSEAELTGEFGVSRATVRTVLTRLTADGLLLRKQGDGTYVNRNIRDVTTHLGGWWEFQRLILGCGYQPSLRLVSFEERLASPEEINQLAWEDDMQAFRVIEMRRIFCADNQPVVLGDTIIPRALFSTTPLQKMGEMPFRALLREYCQQEIAYAMIEMHADQVTASEAQEFSGRKAQGSPILHIHQTFYNGAQRPLALGNSTVDDQFLQLRMVQAWS